jgi:arylsulfatase A-like enzyme
MQRPDGPNFLIIIADQLRHDQLGCTGDGLFETPTLDALAARGVLFENAYSSSTICAPARGSLITGLHPHRYPGHVPHRLGGRSLQSGFWTVPHVLRQAGYQTGIVGKGHYRPIHADHGFSHMRMVEHLSTYDRASHPVDDYTRWLVWQGKADWRATHQFGPEEAEDEATYRHFHSALPFQYPERYHPTHWVTDEALAFLQAREAQRPYCLAVSYPHPHAPYDPPEPWASLYDPADISLDAAAATANDALPPVARAYLRGETGFACLRTDSVEDEVARRILTHIRALVRQIDAAIERLLAAVDLERTVVWFVTDHGDYYGRRGLLMKSPFIPFDDLARVPLLCAGPGVTGGRRYAAPVQSADIAPTMLAQAGIELPPVEFDGASLAEVLQGGETSVERTVYCSSIYRYPMVRRGSLKYFHHEPSGEEMLFDLATDPGETRNLAADAGFAGDLANLRGAMRDQRLRGIPDLPRFESCRRER